MANVAKVVIVNEDDQYLLLYRAEHPLFGDDPDLPGGTVESDETVLEGAVREVKEEAGLDIAASSLVKLCESGNYSHYGHHYVLYILQLDTHPEVEISWEHGKYVWLSKQDFMQEAKNANDTYMHMVHDYLDEQNDRGSEGVKK